MISPDWQARAVAARRMAETQFVTRLAERVALDDDGRCLRPSDNLVATIAATTWQTIEAQLNTGNGAELAPAAGHRPKFCSAFSSCALAVNCFGPFAGASPPLPVPGVGTFGGGLQFEAQRSAGTRGYKPTLDLVAEPTSGDSLFVESKCLEYLRPHTTAFSAAFVRKAEQLLSQTTAAIYKRFFEDPDHYCLLDTAQLLKHFLAAKVAANGRRPVTLLYLYWEPADADDHAIFSDHHREASRLVEGLVDTEVNLVAKSYPELWDAWDNLGDVALATHTRALRERYGFSIAEA